jgi:iron complex outermembrane receptor protein
LGGVILFYPKSFKNNTIENQTTRASFNTWKNTLSAGFNHKKLNTYLLGSVLNSDGYRENNNTNRVNFMLHSEYALSNRIIFQALLKMTKMKAFIPSSIDLTTYLESPQKAATNWKDVRGYEAYSKGQVGLSAKFIPTNWIKYLWLPLEVLKIPLSFVLLIYCRRIPNISDGVVIFKKYGMPEM